MILLITVVENKNHSPVEAGATDSDKQVTVVRHLLTDGNRWNQQW